MDEQKFMTLEIEPHQDKLINQFAQVILDGTVQQARETFEIIFEREPKNDFEMTVFKGLCEQKIKEQEEGTYGIKGVFNGGKSNTH